MLKVINFLCWVFCLLLVFGLWLLSQPIPQEFRPPTPIEAPAKPSKKDLDCLATVVYHESRGEVFRGQLAVASVVMNRAKDSDVNICKVVYEPHQFTDVKDARPNRRSPEWKTAQLVASLAYTGQATDPTNGARFFYAPKKVRMPTWAKNKPIVPIGNHNFVLSQN